MSLFARARKKVLDEWERAYLIAMLTAACGNRTYAAQADKMDRPNLLRLLRKHGLAGFMRKIGGAAVKRAPAVSAGKG